MAGEGLLHIQRYQNLSSQFSHSPPQFSQNKAQSQQ